MAISSPNVVRSATPNQNQIVQAAGVAQRGASDLMNRREQQRQFNTSVLMEFANMDQNTRGMLARRDPELVEAALSEIMGNQEAADLTQGMAEGLLTSSQQAENRLAGAMRLGSLAPPQGGGGGGGQEPAPPYRQGVQPNIQRPDATRGMMRGPGQGETTVQETYRNPAVRGGQVEEARGEAQTYRGMGVQQFEAYDPNAGGYNIPFNQGIRAANDLFPRGEDSATGLFQRGEDGIALNYETFNRRFGKVQDGKVVMPEGSVLAKEDVYGDLSDEEAIRFRAHADIALQRVQSELESGDLTEEAAPERLRQLMSPEAVDPNNPFENFMWDENLSVDQIRDIQTFGEGTLEDMKTRAKQVYAGKINETARENIGEKADTAITPAEEFLNRGNLIRLTRNIDKTRENVGTTESGTWQVNPNLTDEQLIEAVGEVERIYFPASERALPKTAEEARRRATNLLEYTENGLQVFTGGEVGRDAFVQARNFLNEEGYMEARIAMMQNELEMTRMMNEHEIEQDELETTLNLLAFQARQQSAQAESEQARRDGMMDSLGTARGLVEMTTKSGDLSAETLAEEWNNNSALRDGYTSYMKMYSAFLQDEGFDVELKTQELNSGFFQRVFGRPAEVPTLEWQAEEGNLQQATQDLMSDLTPEQQAAMQRLNASLYGAQTR